MPLYTRTVNNADLRIAPLFAPMTIPESEVRTVGNDWNLRFNFSDRSVAPCLEIQLDQSANIRMPDNSGFALLSTACSLWMSVLRSWHAYLSWYREPGGLLEDGLEEFARAEGYGKQEFRYVDKELADLPPFIASMVPSIMMDYDIKDELYVQTLFKNYCHEYMLFQRKTFEGLYAREVVTAKIILGPQHNLRDNSVKTAIRRFLGGIALAVEETPGAVRIVVNIEGALKFGDDCFDMIYPGWVPDDIGPEDLEMLDATATWNVVRLGDPEPPPCPPGQNLIFEGEDGSRKSHFYYPQDGRLWVMFT